MDRIVDGIRKLALGSLPVPFLVAGLMTSPPAATAATRTTRVAVQVNAGGPYRVAAGGSISLDGRFSVAGQSKTVDDLQKIGQALQRYHDVNGSYPPASLSDATGTPLLSWRVLLLPYLGHDTLYRRFDLTKAWDDPANKALLRNMPDVFRGTGQPKVSTNTAYAGVAGLKQLFRGPAAGLGGGVKLSNIFDGADMTTAVGPVGSAVRLPWSAPGDIDGGVATKLGTATGFDGSGNLVTPMLFLDGVVRPITDDTLPGNVQSWSTIAGGGCSPPWSLELKLTPAWDLDNDGTFETTGRAPTFVAGSPGTRTVRFQVVDGFGGVHVSSARVTVR